MERKKSKLKMEVSYEIRELVEAGPYCRRSIYRFIKSGELKANRKRKGKYFIFEKDWYTFLSGT